LAGEQIFRPVLASGEDPIEAATPSCLRGGNTFIFDTDLLLVPNLSPKVASRRLRRSDMMWAAVARFELGKRVAQLPIYVEHDRAREPARGLDADKLFDDVVGYAFFRAAELALAAPEGAAALCDDAVRARVVATAAKYARERVAELRMSAFRARGAAVTIERLLESSVLPGLDEAGATSLRTLCARVALELDDDAIRGLALRIRAAFDDPGFDVFLRQLVVDARVWRARRVAEARTARPMGALLGLGAEGVVFRTGDRFVKVLDGWSEIDRERAVPVLHHLATRPATAALPRVLCVDDSAPPVVLQADFTPSEPVVRPEAAEVVALLRALRRAGWAMTNLKADNLRRTDRGLRVIDLGRSIVPWSAENERTMAREAWLLLHHHHHDVDLPALVRRSRTRDDLPELVGVDALVAAVRDDPKQRLDEAIAHAVERLAPRSVLDFGCGKPRAWQRLANGRRFVAFDPDSRLRSRWTAEAPSVAFVDGVDALDGDPFEAAICSLVLCSLDDGDARTALHRLRRVLRPGSAAIVAVCDPRAVHVPRTARHGRCVPEGARYADHFAYAKQVDDGGVRVEHHRPLEDNIAMITACGFRVCSQSTIEGVDLATWKSAPEFVVLELEATPFQAVARRRAPLSGLTTICYHRVSDAERSGGPRLDAWRKRGMVVSTSTFHQHLGDASRLFELVRLVDVVRAAERGDALPRRSLLVTFDDGYRDVVDTIAPALERFDVPATFFVRRPTTDGFPTWAPLDLLYAALGSVAPGPHRSPPTGPSREGLLERPIQEQLGVVAAEVRRHGMDVRDLDRATVYASARDLEALRARGHSLGAHGVEHVRWTTLPDDELGAAARACARWMATLDATTFAYPDAALSRRTTRALARAGFALGFGLEAPAPLGVLKALALERVVARDEVLQIEAIARSAEEER
jgi:peptidoglycan/xylan/chitin deacetylase (PgdA/CDA1 family)/SAM-dependent methyltransferase